LYDALQFLHLQSGPGGRRIGDGPSVEGALMTAVSTDEGRDTAPGAAFVAAVVSQDRGALSAVLDEHVQVRALAPRGLRVADGSGPAVDLVAGWFADATAIEVLASEVDAIGERVHVWYRLRLMKGGEVRVVEQHVFASVGDGRVRSLDLLCSGFHPAGTPSAPAATGRRRFDAGELGCGDGLPSAFREELAALAVGDRLEVLASDPAARADLPSLARLMGHSIETTEDLPDGRVRVVVEKRR
jgi:TusA-related sulfurtransferase